MTIDKYNYMDKGELRNRIRELEAELARFVRVPSSSYYIKKLEENLVEVTEAQNKAVDRAEKAEAELASVKAQRDEWTRIARARAEKAEANWQEADEEMLTWKNRATKAEAEVERLRHLGGAPPGVSPSPPPGLKPCPVKGCTNRCFYWQTRCLRHSLRNGPANVNEKKEA